MSTMTLPAVVAPYSPPLASSVPPPAIFTDPVWRFTVEQYHQMIRTGILDEDSPVELLEGWIVAKMPRNPPHDALVSHLCLDVLGPRLPAGWFCRSQSAMTAPDSEPEPDVAVVRGKSLDYFTRHPGAEDMPLGMEVADSSLARDRGLKQRIYARAKVPVYWIVTLVDRIVEVYTDPTGPDDQPRYRARQDYRIGDVVPFMVDNQDLGSIPVAENMPQLPTAP